ncbi:MAG: hypothetical protein NXI02_21960, partial [Rhodobacteraceae bacterium]|nr:hypothetical protein [Paracoccaceae bacterium]
MNTVTNTRQGSASAAAFVGLTTAQGADALPNLSKTITAALLLSGDARLRNAPSNAAVETFNNGKQ